MKRKLFSFCLIYLLLMGSACKKNFLDLEPLSSATDENFWKSGEDANAAVAAMYALLRNSFNEANGMAFYAYGDLATDEFTASNTYPFNQVLTMQWNLTVAAADVNNPMYLLRHYGDYYKIIDQANRVIKHLPAMDISLFTSADRRNYLLGEAYFMRAFTYFYMGRIWGGVPIVTEAVVPINATNHEAATAEQVMEQSLKDLQKAKELLSWRNPVTADFAVRANKGAAFALEAHVQAWSGKYAESAAAADSVILSNLYLYNSRDSLAYRTIFRGQSVEGVFEISQSKEDEGTSTGIGNFTLVSPYHRLINTPRLTISPAHIKTLYADRQDKRLRFAFDTTINTSFVICSKYANLTYTNETNNAIPVFKNNIIVFRYSDIKLLRAEALAATGREADAITILNEVRMQAGLPVWDEQGILAKAIFDERARELFLEGHRYYDLVRLYKYFKIFEFPQARMNVAQFNMGKHYWPFDPAMLNQNPLLRQTPYWATVNF